MKFFMNLQSKKNKKNYELLRDIKDELDSVSLNISILNDRINLYKKSLSLSSDKIDNYLTKIKASANKNNISLCKKGFFKFYRENLIYNSILQNSNSFSKEFSNITTTLVSLQDEFNILDESFSNSINSSKFTFKDIFSQSISNFSNKLYDLSHTVKVLSEKVPRPQKSFSPLDGSTIFEDEAHFLSLFEDFLKQHNIKF
ncbi:MAG: hypothetical protein ACRC28_14040 [Clostridium sp.]|uniref:hypothetical protein n=1 Tax=Clostridium sp. TaxID=1506 RepID=UPI003F3751FA